MPELEPIRTAPSSVPREGGRSRRNTASSRASSRQRQALAHVHSFHLDDHSVYQDHLHDHTSEDEDQLEDVVDDGEADPEKGGQRRQKKTKAGGSAQGTPDDSSDTIHGSGGDSESSSVSEKTSRKSTEKSALSLKKQQSSKSIKDPNLVTWDSPEDPANPKNWTKKQKWSATLVVSSFTFISPISSSMVAPALETMAKEFNITNAVESQLMLSVFVLAYAIGPLFLGPLSEMFGRVIVLQLANLFYLVFNTACGASKNASMLIAFRFLSGLGGSAPLAIGGGVLSDAWQAHERGAAIAIYSLMPLLGPAIGPIAGGFVTANTTWRWIFYATSICDALIQLFGLFFLRETYPPAILAKKRRRLQKETGNMKLHTEFDHPDRTIVKHLSTAMSRPFRLLFTQPIVQVLAIYMAYLYGLMYLLLSTYPMVWQQVYNESVSIGSLNYLSLGIGFSLGTQICARIQDRLYKRLRKRNNGVGKPEFRVPLMIPGSILIPTGLFIYGWTAQYKTHWIAPNIGGAIFAFGAIMCFQCIQTFLVDAYTRYAASAIGAATVLRSLAGFGFPLFAPYMYQALNLGWGNSLLGFVGLALGLPAPVLLWLYGEKLRKRSPFAAGGGF